MTDNTYNHEYTDDTYVTGNLARVAAINLPGFIKETDESSAENQMQAGPLSHPSLAQPPTSMLSRTSDGSCP